MPTEGAMSNNLVSNTRVQMNNLIACGRKFAEFEKATSPDIIRASRAPAAPKQQLVIG
jgi:hypothetical protein